LQGQHSDIVGNPVTRDDMLELAGKDLCAIRCRRAD